MRWFIYFKLYNLHFSLRRRRIDWFRIKLDWNMMMIVLYLRLHAFKEAG